VGPTGGGKKNFESDVSPAPGKRKRKGKGGSRTGEKENLPIGGGVAKVTLRLDTKKKKGARSAGGHGDTGGNVRPKHAQPEREKTVDGKKKKTPSAKKRGPISEPARKEKPWWGKVGEPVKAGHAKRLKEKRFTPTSSSIHEKKVDSKSASQEKFP